MRATNWEFKNRALLFGLIFGFAFFCYSFDPQNSTAALANWLAARSTYNPDHLARALFGLASIFLVAAAAVRTWASSYLHADIVYASQVKTATLVADGPYRRSRNPLYFGNALMAIGMGAMASRTGFFLLIIVMLLFCYRLILREESDLRLAQGPSYDEYRKLVPRLWPSPRRRLASSGAQAMWANGFKAEFWCWGFAIAVIIFAITLNTKLFFVALCVSLACLWLVSKTSSRKALDRGNEG